MNTVRFQVKFTFSNDPIVKTIVEDYFNMGLMKFEVKSQPLCLIYHLELALIVSEMVDDRFKPWMEDYNYGGYSTQF